MEESKLILASRALNIGTAFAVLTLIMAVFVNLW